MTIADYAASDASRKTGVAIHWWAALAVLLNLTVLVYFAATATIWDDEAAAFYLAKQSLADICGIMSTNIYEDPPAYFLLLHSWLPVAGFSPLLLRMTGLVFWVGVLCGVFLTARRLGGERAGWYALLATAAMPYHWFVPATIRWFSLFACMAVLNLYCFVVVLQGLMGAGRPSLERRGWWAAAGYVLTGSVMWYTNYSAPVYFFAHLVICLVCSDQRRALTSWLVGCWVAISLVYLPWLPILFRQLQVSVSPQFFGPLVVLRSVWDLLAGQFSTPFAWWISVPLAGACLLACGLMLLQFPRVRLPLLVVGVVMAALLIARCPTPMRMILVSPFLALAVGLSLAPAEHPTRTWRWLRRGFVVLAVVVLGGTALNVVRHRDWSSYRPLDPLAEAVEEVQREHPEALLVTNSNCVLFYLRDDFGKIGAIGVLGLSAETFRPKAIVYPWKEWRYRAEDKAFDNCASVAYIHHATYGVYSRAFTELSNRLARHGLHPVSSRGMLQVPSHLIRVHPRMKHGGQSSYDDKRVVITYFRRANDASNTAALGAKLEGNYPQDDLSRKPRLPHQATVVK